MVRSEVVVGGGEGVVRWWSGEVRSGEGEW